MAWVGACVCVWGRQIPGDNAFVISGDVALSVAAGPGIRGIRHLRGHRREFSSGGDDG